MSIINKLRLNASKVDKSIIFPDGNDERTIKAANELGIECLEFKHSENIF